MLMLLVYVGENRFTIDCEPILGIFPKVILKQFLHSEPSIIGLMNYEGMPVPIIDFSYLVEKRYSKDSFHTRIFLLSHVSPGGNNKTIGLLAEGVTEMVNYDVADFKPSSLKQEELPFISGIMTLEEGVIQRIEVEELFKYLSSFLE